MDTITHYIDGRLVEPLSRAYLDNIDPSTGRVYSRVPDGDERDVQAAVDAAKRAFPTWSHTKAAERSRIMLRIADLIDANLDKLALAECIDNGKPISVAKSLDIPRAAANMRFFATAILHSTSDAHITDHAAINYTLRRPRGVAGCISPWNLPLYLFTWKIAPAIATGNTAVAKPSEITPMTAHLFAQLCIEAGLPPGVLNIIHGTGPKVGAAIVAHPDVPTITFTGGTVTGAAIARTAAPMFKKLSLELGGKNPNIVFADANLDQAIATSVQSSFANQGQICLCGSRIFVEESAYSTFVDRLVQAAQELKIGDPLDPTTQQGALVSRAQIDKVSSYVELARSDSGRIRCGGAKPTAINERCKDGYYFQPTVITDLPVNCRVNTEEIFGPVVTVTPFKTEDEVVQHANATQYGLSATLWTRDLSRAHRIADRLQSGTVWVNCWLLRDLRVPFGGMKSSGVGREGGDEALRFFTEPKNVCISTSSA